jgi:hypothetical protein
MNEIISGAYVDHDLIVGEGRIWIVNDTNEVQINKTTIEKYEIVDTTSITTSHSTTTSKGSSRKGTKSMAGRAIVGGVLFGPVGAVVGAGTAKNKNKSVSTGITTSTTKREFKVLVTLKDSSQALFHLDEIGYDNFLVAVFAEPYETITEILKAKAEVLKAQKEATKKVWIKFFKFVICPLIYLSLFVHYPIPILLLTVVIAGWVTYKKINKKTKKNKTNNSAA